MANATNTIITVSLFAGLGLAGAYFFRLMCPGAALQAIGNGTWCPPTAPILSPAEGAVYGDIQKPGTKGVVLPRLGTGSDFGSGTIYDPKYNCCQGKSCIVASNIDDCCHWRGQHGGCPSGSVGVRAGPNSCSCSKSTTPAKSWCPGKSGNCTWDCKSAYCWTSGNQKWCGQCNGCGTNIVTGCNLARQGYLKSQCNGLTGATYNSCLKAHGLMARVGSRRARITIS